MVEEASARTAAETAGPECGRTRSGVAWSFLVIALVLIAPRFVVSPFLPTPLLDDWLYQLSVKRLIEHHQLWVSPLAVATLVGQVGWGALFALPFGINPPVLRISTLVASLAGAAGLYLMCRELGAARPLAIAGSLAVWLHPVAFVLSYTFMTDVPFLALVCLAGWLYVRGIQRGSGAALLLGSVCAGGAFLVRQQGALLPATVVLWLLLCRPAWFRRHPWRMIAAVILPCLVAVIGYYALALVVGLPSMQATFFRTLRDAGPFAILDQVWRIAVIALFYTGICFLPLLAGAWGGLQGTARSSPRTARILASGCLVLMLGWTLIYALQHGGASFPFLHGGQMIRPDGFATDAYGSRPDLLPKPVWLIVSIVLAVATSTGVLLVASQMIRRTATSSNGVAPGPGPGLFRKVGHAARSYERDDNQSEHRDQGGERFRPVGRRVAWETPLLLVLFALVQLGGIIPAALYRPELITYDRYLLPIFPFAVGLLVWALRGRTWSPAPVIAVFAILLVINTLGMQDWFAYKRAEWATDVWLTTSKGVPLGQVDGYGQWVGLHFYEQTVFGPPQAPVPQPGAPWWLDDIAPGLDPVYVVAAAPNVRAGYAVVVKRSYHSWIRPAGDSWVYVLNWEGEP